MSTQAIQKQLATCYNLNQTDSAQKQAKNHNKIKIDLRKTEYPILMNVATNSLGWRIWSTITQNKDERDIIWNDNYISEGQVRQLHSYQRINHFPGSQELGKKNYLAANLFKMKSSFKDDFFPLTWLLPKDTMQFKKVLQNDSNRSYYIAKPQASSQGRGIFLFRSVSQLPQNWENYNLVIQKYISKPYLIEGLKFDFRIYVLLRSVNPLRVYIYEEGLARFATCKYESPNESNFNNAMMHLTNYAINKRNPQFIYNTSNKDYSIGHKRSYSCVMETLKRMKVNTQKLQSEIDSIIIKTILSGLPSMNEIYKKTRQNKQITSVCFQILGFDIMIDQNHTPFLIEVNHTPSFVTDTPLDYTIKKSLIQDTLNIIRTDIDGKKQFLAGKNISINKLMSDVQLKDMQTQEDNYQQKNRGSYRRIFPTTNIQLTRIHDQILGIKPLKLSRINYQSLNKNRIVELNKKNKSSVKQFPSILQLSDSLYQGRNNYFERFDIMQDKPSKLDRSMPIQSLMRNMLKTENKFMANQTSWLQKTKLNSKNTWILNKIENSEKNNSKELEPLRFKNLEIDFYMPPTRQIRIKNSMTYSPIKQFTEKQSDFITPKKRSFSTARKVLFNFQKHKKQNDQEKLSQVKLTSQKLIQQPLSTDANPQQEASSFKKSVRIRDTTQIRPSLNNLFYNYSRKFSCEQKRLIIGYD